MKNLVSIDFHGHFSSYPQPHPRTRGNLEKIFIEFHSLMHHHIWRRPFILSECCSRINRYRIHMQWVQSRYGSVISTNMWLMIWRDPLYAASSHVHDTFVLPFLVVITYLGLDMFDWHAVRCAVQHHKHTHMALLLAIHTMGVCMDLRSVSKLMRQQMCTTSTSLTDQVVMYMCAYKFWLTRSNRFGRVKISEMRRKTNIYTLIYWEIELSNNIIICMRWEGKTKRLSFNVYV